MVDDKEKQTDEKIANIKKQLLANKVNSARVIYGVLTEAKIAEHKAKKVRARKRNKVQKQSRKNNR